jgi:hypothetical protein
MSRRERALAALVLLLAAGACVPQRAQKVPPVRGTLLRGTTPVAEALVTWTTENPGGDVVAGAATDEAGRFELQAVKRWEWVLIVAPVHATARWRVEASEKDRAARVIWRGKHFGAGPPRVPAPFVLECDLAQREPCLLRDAPDDQRYVGSSGRLPIE